MENHKKHESTTKTIRNLKKVKKKKERKNKFYIYIKHTAKCAICIGMILLTIGM